MELTDVARPGLMISNTEPESRKMSGRTFEVLQQAMKLDFFRAYQTVEVPYPEERHRIARAVKANDLVMTYCLARVLNENKLDLSSPDEELRTASVEALLMHFDDAAEQAADSIQIVSGPAPADPEQRSQHLSQFEKSWLELCQAAQNKGIKVILEPLDVSVHKKGTLGFTSEAVEMAESLSLEVCNALLCLDTSHMILNGEDVVASLGEAVGYVDEFHFCNPVLDRDHPLFGDTHIKLGLPGELDVERVGQLMARLFQEGFLSESRRPKLFLEVRNRDETARDLMLYCRQSLLDAWAIARSRLEDPVA
jgi:sugar phosphate isomerase/epimerase